MSLFFLCSFIFFFLHIVLWHFKLSAHRGVMKLLILACVSSLISMGFYVLSRQVLTLEIILVALPLFAMTVMLYLHWYVGIDRSLSVRVLGELVSAPGYVLTNIELQQRYPQAHMLEHRLELLVQNKWLLKNQGRYECTPKGQHIAQAAIFFKKLYGLTLTG